MAKRKKSNLGVLVVLLALVAGYGAWNYQRNVEADGKQVRPYKSYSDEDLAQLLAAYQGQAEQLSTRYDRAAAQRSGSRDVKMVGDGVDEFARVQQHSRAIRELGSQASQELASVKAIEQERAYRARSGSGWLAFLRRAFVPPSS